MDLNLKHYTDEFFKKHIPWRADYGLISGWINENVSGKIFGDVGCGNGFLIQDLYARYKKKIWGVDGSEHFMENVDPGIRSMVKKVDLTEHAKLDKADVVICLEVAEHIPFEFSDILVQNIISAKPRTLIFTAAPPSQSGTNHINLQLPHFWAVKFEQYGYFLDIKLTEKFRQDLKGKLRYTPWYLENWLILRKKDTFTKGDLLKLHGLAEGYLSLSFKQRIEKKLNSIDAELARDKGELESSHAALGSSQKDKNIIQAQFDKAQYELKLVKEAKLNLETELNQVYTSRTWRMAVILRKLSQNIIPNQSLRRSLASVLWKTLKFLKRLTRRTPVAATVSKKERKINLNSKKIVFVGHSYHAKTQSTKFLIDYLKEFFDVTVVLDESWMQKPFADLSFIDDSYLGVIFFQNVPDLDYLNRIKNDNIIFFPMYDAAHDWDRSFWRQLQGLKIVNFSRTLHEKLSNWGLDSTHVQYFPKPTEFSPGQPDEVFFWQRRTEININTIAPLFENTPVKIHLHKAVDPYHQFVPPDPEDEQKFQITYSDWFENKQQLLDIVKKKGIYVAPREIEGIGLSFLEAMAMGKAVVAVNNPTMNEYIKHNETGYLFDLSKPRPIDFSNIEQVQKNVYEFMQQGYKQWLADAKKIIKVINK